MSLNYSEQMKQRLKEEDDILLIRKKEAGSVEEIELKTRTKNKNEAAP